MKGYTPTPLFGTNRGLELPPPVAQQPEDSAPTTLGEIISGILPGSSRHHEEELPPDYPPAPRAPDSSPAAVQPARAVPRQARPVDPVYEERPVYRGRDRYGDDLPPEDVPVRDYRAYRGPYDSPAPMPPGEVGEGPVPPGDVGYDRPVRERGRTTLLDILTGQ
jgi:penicillin-binding protein 1A